MVKSLGRWSPAKTPKVAATFKLTLDANPVRDGWRLTRGHYELKAGITYRLALLRRMPATGLLRCIVETEAGVVGVDVRASEVVLS